MGLRAITVALWLAAAGSVLAWAALERRAAAGTAAVVAPAAAVTAFAGPWDRLLGAAEREVAPVAPAAVPVGAPAADLRLLGVVAARQQSLALIAVDGQPPRVVPVGGLVYGGLRLQSVSLAGVVLATPGGGPALELALAPPRTAPAGPVRVPAHRASEDDVDDTSPIVPPHADMRTPAARHATTPESDWARQRASPVPGDAAAQPVLDAPVDRRPSM